ncbi:MAG TPA: alpha-ketoglutarate-dependent dioxygenase AlkB [Puia sp.]|nr:alpha-ketoglutarate-dependent dioxygenase AlkB [Puia sp.]
MQNHLFETDRNILPFAGEVLLFEHFFCTDECEKYFEYLKEKIIWKQEPIWIFGRKVMQPRMTAWYGDEGKSYTYSGRTMHPRNWTSELREIKSRIEIIAKASFTSALLNLYRNGNDSMGWHRDNEKELGENPVIGSVSFGATRIFRFRNYSDKKLTRSIELSNGSLLLMRGETQHYWEHALPKTKCHTGERINITFRTIR